MNIKELAKEAQKKGICSPGMKKILQSNDKEALLNYYIEGLDFCMEHDFPSKDYLKTQGGDLLALKGIYIDEDIAPVNNRMLVLLGKCKVHVVANEYSVMDVFVKHDSTVQLYANDHSFVRVDCFDTVNVRIHASGNAKIVVNVYGSAKVAYEKKEKAQIKIINKGKETY
ncbi:hypothetical protein FKG96_12475 [Olivibacter sp. LS-1]|uniref:hypothetical protein n=1 Tax=Olivibacter sp. LS-1 TaxID=2592345 RepID=UPI0011EAFA5C|nr:hypothetical protein [Olivibacter sp. LS-1]QEL01587.1 hypothetical protein FKG96_12475 [Olivibacter sp. LS-1]